jgi:hypothetical protein
MTDDKMPPLPAYVYGRETAANERLIPLGDAEAWRNAARAYAAEQVRELVEALHELIKAPSGAGTCGESVATRPRTLTRSCTTIGPNSSTEQDGSARPHRQAQGDAVSDTKELIERLRSAAWGGLVPMPRVCDEAADTIARLEAERDAARRRTGRSIHRQVNARWRCRRRWTARSACVVA